jgi:hypothetical protein
LRISRRPRRLRRAEAGQLAHAGLVIDGETLRLAGQEGAGQRQ